MTNPLSPSLRNNRDRPRRDFLVFVLPLLALLGVGGIGLWRERMAGLTEQAQRLTWLANTAAGQASELLEKERTAWAWTEARVDRDGKISGRAWFEEAPMPQAENEGGRLLAAGRFQEVIERFPGELSAAGMPLGPVAAYRKLLAAPDSGAAVDAARNLRELAFAYPSALTEQLLDAADQEMTRRRLTDPAATPWRERWQTVERIAGHLNRLLERPLPAPGAGVTVANGEAWFLETARDDAGVRVLAFPADRFVEDTRKIWENLPLEPGTCLALTGGEAQLLPPPDNSADWPRAEVALGNGAMHVLVVRDPSAFARATRTRVWLLGGIGLCAGLVMAGAWWRQRRAMTLQRDLVRQKDDFLSTVSHELRTPVAAMQILSENLVTGTVTDPDATARYHERLLHESRRLVATTEHLLDFSLMERGHKTYQFAPLELSVLANEVKTVLQPAAAARKIELCVQVRPVSPPPFGDSEGLRRLILNLGDNAIKFSPQNSRVTIALGPGPAGNWQIEVADHGPGIPPHEQEHIFERFFRGGNVLDRATRGTGIGLSVARHIAEGHGGNISLTASSADGSVFTCVLPCNPPDMSTIP